MASQRVTGRLEALRVTQSHSRPRTSNDNRFSEASCQTLKYWPDFAHRFPTLVGARRFLRRCFAWYNTAHRQRGLGWPSQTGGPRCWRRHTPVTPSALLRSTTRSPRGCVLNSSKICSISQRS